MKMVCRDLELNDDGKYENVEVGFANQREEELRSVARQLSFLSFNLNLISSFPFSSTIGYEDKDLDT